MATVSFTGGGSSHVELPLRQFDADEYMAMAQAGVFETNKRVELIGGYIVDMSPSGSDHSYVVNRFPHLFADLKERFQFWVQGTLRVDRRHVLDPDFMLLNPRQQSYRHALPIPQDVALLVEVSASSLARDLDVKLPIYAAHSIPEYWIADVDRDVIIVHRQPSGNVYRDVREYSGDAMIAAWAAPDLAIRARQIFD